MGTFSKDISDILESNFSELVFGTNLFISHEPDMPNDTITIYDTGGISDQEIDPTNNFTRHPEVQLRVRNVSYVDGHSQLENLIQFLKTIYNLEINGNYYGSIVQNTEIISLGKDNRERFRLVCNLTSTREESCDS